MVRRTAAGRNCHHVLEYRAAGVFFPGTREPDRISWQRRPLFIDSGSYFPAGLDRFYAGLFQNRDTALESCRGFYTFGAGGLFYLQEITKKSRTIAISENRSKFALNLNL